MNLVLSKKLDALAESIVKSAVRKNLRFVLAESCTGGLPAHLLTRIPGVSQVFCGSMISYRVDSKIQWLSIPSALIENPGVVSAEVASEMAIAVLQQTPEATFSVASTGHLGPDAPPDLDGRVYFGIATREPKSGRTLPKGSEWTKVGSIWTASVAVQLPASRSRRPEFARKARVALSSLSMLKVVRSLL